MWVCTVRGGVLAACTSRAGGEGGHVPVGFPCTFLVIFVVLAMFILKKTKKRKHLCEELLDSKRFLLAAGGRMYVGGKKLPQSGSDRSQRNNK